MSYFTDLWTDLVEKRLWPVAVALLLALVAVPIVLGASGDVAAPSGTTGTTGAAGQRAEVALDAPGAVRRDRAGDERNPFKQRALRQAAAATATASVAATPQDTGASSAAGGTGFTVPSKPDVPSFGGSGPTPSTPLPGPPPKAIPPAPDADSYSLVLRFGKTGSARGRREVERLSPLPSAEDPFFVYLGVLPDEKTAVFLLSSDVKATGDGACKPRSSSCETVELRRGDTEYLDVTAEDGSVTQYQLDLVRIEKRAAGSASSSETPRQVAKRAKAATQASAEDTLGSERYEYDDATGLLRRVKSVVGLGGHLPGVESSRASLRASTAEDEPAGFPEYYPGT